MRIVVTGGAGFIGSHLVNRLRQSGHAVVVVDRLATELSPAIDILEPQAIASAVAGADAVCHLAAVADVDYALREPVETLSVNVTGTATVLDALRAQEGARFILASTIWVYSACARPGADLDEDAPITPAATNHVYTTSKVGAEMVAHNYGDRYGMPITILRFGIPYGPGMREHAVIPAFVRAVLDGEAITINDDGRQLRQFIDVRDLCAAVATVLAAPPAPRTLNLVTPEPIAIRDLARLVMQVLGREVPVHCGPPRPGDAAWAYTVSGARARTELGWEPAIALADGIRDYATWLTRRA